MTTPRKRLPQDSVVSSLSEIQSILRDDDARPTTSAKTASSLVESGGPSRPASNVDVALVGEVPDASQVDAARRARWATVERPVPGPTSTSSPWRRVWALGAGAALVGLGVYFVSREPNSPLGTSAVTSPEVVASVPAAPPASSAPPSSAVPVSARVVEVPATAAPTAPPRKTTRAPVRKAPKRKVDKQFDDVLDGL
jgi:hypothetical protein